MEIGSNVNVIVKVNKLRGTDAVECSESNDRQQCDKQPGGSIEAKRRGVRMWKRHGLSGAHGCKKSLGRAEAFWNRKSFQAAYPRRTDLVSSSVRTTAGTSVARVRSALA